MTIDITKPEGSRVISLEVRCDDCAQDTNYEMINLEKDYAVVTSSYLINGGDGNKILKEKSRNRIEGKRYIFISHVYYL